MLNKINELENWISINQFSSLDVVNETMVLDAGAVVEFIKSLKDDPAEIEEGELYERKKWQAAKAQTVPERKYILQTFSIYGGVCEQEFNHKDVGVFESIDAAMFHARNIGLVMNHYGYEFRVIEAQEFT